MKILVSILTCSQTQMQANACFNTWVQDIKPPHDYIFYGDKRQSGFMENTWNCSPDEGEARCRLPEKTYKMLKKSLDYDWDFLFKCDDDTYLEFSRLEEFLKKYNPKEDLYIGCMIGKGIKPFPYAQGGAGYALTRSSVEKCLEVLETLYDDQSRNRKAEDFSVGLSLREQGINLISSKLFNSTKPWIAKDNQSICCNAILKDNCITTHYINPETILKVHKEKFLKQQKK